LATKKNRSKKKTTKNGSESPDEGIAPRYPEIASQTLSDLAQVKALADPLRLRLLEAFCQERTTKQVADLLDERPTRLYHHVEALEKVGLIQQTRTRQNRGTLEKYFLAAARSFKADSELFAQMSTAPEGTDPLRGAMSSIFDNTRDELDEILANGDMSKAVTEEGLVGYVELHSSQEFVDKLHRRLKRLVSDMQKECARDLEASEKAGKSPGRAGEPGPEDRRYRLTVAFFPLDWRTKY
jgi:DNA-binding transcriptional ArsR family regulator